MSHRRPPHPLERWAQDAAQVMPKAGITKTKLIAEVSIMERLRRESEPNEKAKAIQSPLTQMVFAADCLSGRAQIVHIADGLYEDVLESKLTETDKSDSRTSGDLPWPMFAIELNHCKTQLALVVSSTGYLMSRAEEAERLLGVSDHALQMLAETLCEAQGTDATTLAFIPSPDTCRKAKEDMRSAMLRATDDLEQQKQLSQVSDYIGPIPYPLWSKPGDDAPSPDDVVNLIMFVMSDNVERKQTYAPPAESTKSKKKRKRCEAHLYEMGVEWSDAYRAYRKAMRNDPKGGHVRPHTRRGHFHRFRVGPRDGDIRYVTHWLPPTLVGDVSRYKPTNQGHIYRRRTDDQEDKT